MTLINHDQREACKTCPSCGREFSWRRKWAADWHSVRFCSSQCSRRGEIDSAVLRLMRSAIQNVPIRTFVAIKDVIPAGDRVQEALSALRWLATDGSLEFRNRGRTVSPSHAGLLSEVRRMKGMQ